MVCRDGVRKSYSGAAHWYDQAVLKGDAVGRYNLAFLHFRGLGVAQDSARGALLLEEAAALGSVEAACMGDNLMQGQRVAADRDSAIIWFERAALEEHAGSIAALTSLREADQGGNADPTKTLNLWLGAAGRGDAGAQCVVDDLYLRGEGTESSLFGDLLDATSITNSAQSCVFWVAATLDT